ncbi:tyrosine-protein kinase domain-containing protein [Euzebya tangerina]|uniref:tyrosine-protein kinase domain-containing protein n=1 Tax=Euzebya tangerina TaxID=591198 RepID=UPI000E30D27F|nr:CpsD/CapB family tyrosine-protein kinase [Euzebya tangerina]
MNESLRAGPTLLESLWRYRLPVVLFPLVMGVIGFFVTSAQPPSYDATAVLFLTNPGTLPGMGIDSRPRISPQEFVPQQAARASSRSVLEAARESLENAPSIQDLIDHTSIDSNIEDLLLRVNATADTAEEAAEIANAIATAYMTQNRERERADAAAAVFEVNEQISSLEASLEQVQSQLNDDPSNLALQSQIQSLSARLIELESTVSTVEAQAQLRGDGVDELEEARPPELPARPQVRLGVAIWGFLSGIAAAIWAYWYAGRSQRVLNRTDPEDVLGVPLLGEIPLYRAEADDELTGLLQLDPAAAEAYEFVLSSIEFALGDTVGGKSLMVTSTLPGDGKTTTSLQLAIAASRDRRRVMMVDADIRARGLTTVLRAQDRPGLSDIAADGVKVADVVRRYRFSESSQIPVVTAGQRRGDPAALLRTNVFRKTMNEIRASAELVIIDSSPLLAVADAVIVSGSADGMVLVVSHGTPVSELQKVRERLKFVSTPLLGYVFNRSDATTAAAYGYGYGIAEDTDGQRRLLPKTRRAKERSRPEPEPRRHLVARPSERYEPDVEDVSNNGGSEAAERAQVTDHEEL